MTSWRTTSSLIFCLLALNSCKRPTRANRPTHAVPRQVAHAGGAIRGMTYTNSLQALHHNYWRGFRYFEIDLEWTKDRHLVLLHDWHKTFRRLFPTGPAKVPVTHADFLQLTMISGLTPLSLDELVKWLEVHADAYVITDIKRENIRALRRIKERYPQIMERIVPQIYHFQEYQPVTTLGFRRIILTLYRMKPEPSDVLRFAKANSLFAVCMWEDLALRSQLSLNLHTLGIPVYAHTVNSPERHRALLKRGVRGIYTDYLIDSADEVAIE